jgi:hypothetical protein
MSNFYKNARMCFLRFLCKKAGFSQMPEEWKGIGGAPLGYKAVTSKLPPEVVNEARNTLNEKRMGEINYFIYDRTEYAIKIEPHYHSPESGKTPVGYHKGATVYVVSDTSTPALTPKPVTNTPPTSKKKQPSSQQNEQINEIWEELERLPSELGYVD